MTSTALPAQSFRQWCYGDNLQETLARAENDVRARPTDLHARWLLLELLCVMGAWDRALKQLQTCATLSPPDLAGTAQALRNLIRAERQREEVFLGRQKPVPVIDLSGWMHKLSQALERNAAQDHDSADALREAALTEAADVPGQGTLGHFAWIADTDTRLGPVCELVTAGSYRWLAFADLRSIAIEAPTRLLDLIWIGADMVLRDGSPLKAYIPVRYPDTPSTTDALRLAHETAWREVGCTGVFGYGQKTWMTDTGDWPLLDVRHCEFTGTDVKP